MINSLFLLEIFPLIDQDSVAEMLDTQPKPFFTSKIRWKSQCTPDNIELWRFIVAFAFHTSVFSCNWSICKQFLSHCKWTMLIHLWTGIQRHKKPIQSRGHTSGIWFSPGRVTYRFFGVGHSNMSESELVAVSDGVMWRVASKLNSWIQLLTLTLLQTHGGKESLLITRPIKHCHLTIPIKRFITGYDC